MAAVLPDASHAAAAVVAAEVLSKEASQLGPSMEASVRQFSMEASVQFQL